MSLSTHALDTATGTPAVGLGYRLTDSAGTDLASGVTDADGRGPDLAQVEVGAGVYRLAFEGCPRRHPGSGSPTTSRRRRRSSPG